MRIVITGAAGFFGSRAAGHFAQAHDVVALDRADANRARLDALAPAARFVACDLDARGELEAVVARERPDACLHLAWYAVPGKYLEAPENLDCLASSLRLARALAASGCKRLVTAGTCFEYALDETTSSPLAETSPTGPRFLYSGCKLAMFEALREACRVFGMSHAHARFFYQYGPWEAPGRLVPAILGALLRGEEAKTTEGLQVRDFLHIDDVASAIVAIVRSDLRGVVNVGSGVPVRVREVVLAAARACGREESVRLGALPSRPGDPPYVCADASRLRGLGWSPRLSLDDGLADTVAWYKSAAT